METLIRIAAFLGVLCSISAAFGFSTILVSTQLWFAFPTVVNIRLVSDLLLVLVVFICFRIVFNSTPNESTETVEGTAAESTAAPSASQLSRCLDKVDRIVTSEPILNGHIFNACAAFVTCTLVFLSIFQLLLTTTSSDGASMIALAHAAIDPEHPLAAPDSIAEYDTISRLITLYRYSLGWIWWTSLLMLITLSPFAAFFCTRAIILWPSVGGMITTSATTTKLQPLELERKRRPRYRNRPSDTSAQLLDASGEELV